MKRIAYKHLLIFSFFHIIFYQYRDINASYESIAPGVYYKNYTTQNPTQSIHVVVANPHTVKISVAIADDICASSKKTSELAQKHNAIAAINGGFFDFGCKSKIKDVLIKLLDCFGSSHYNAFPINTLAINNNYYALSDVITGAVGWHNQDQHPFFGGIKTTATLTINTQTYRVNELNKPEPNGPTLYNSFYDQKSPALNGNFDEIIIEKNHIKKIYPKSHGKKIIPQNGYIYAVPTNATSPKNSFKIGDPACITITNNHSSPEHARNSQTQNPDQSQHKQKIQNTQSPAQPQQALYAEQKNTNTQNNTPHIKHDLPDIKQTKNSSHSAFHINHATKSLPTTDTILASTPLLLRNSTIISDLENNSSEFYTHKHPRTAVGVLKNGNWVLVVVDGRQKHSSGLTLLELAQLMKKLGCTDALNLDGGGSSTMVIKDKVVNSPSGREYCLIRKERPVSNALLICAK